MSSNIANLIMVIYLIVAIIADNVEIYCLRKQISALEKLLGWAEDGE